MPFKFYIIDEEYMVTGTNNRSAAEVASQDPAIYAVIDVEANKDLCMSTSLEVAADTTYTPS